MSFSCPLCHQPLTQANNSFVCPGRHQFDVAKEGYVNLLPVQHKRSRDPGDSAEMMQARRAFLDAGHYQPLRDAIVNVLKEKSNSEDAAILDIGCGEGFVLVGTEDKELHRGVLSDSSAATTTSTGRN